MGSKKDKPCDVEFVTGCKEKLSPSDYGEKYKNKTCRFLCFSKDEGVEGKIYRVSLFPLNGGPSCLEVINKNIAESSWIVEGEGVLSYGLMKRCGERFAAWSGDKFLDKDKKYPGHPKDEVLAREIKLVIEKFCLSGLVTVKFVNSHGNNFEEVGRENFGKMNLNFVCSISPKTDIYTVTIFVRDNDFPHTAIVDRLICKDEKIIIAGGGIAFFDSRKESDCKYKTIWGMTDLGNWGHPDRPSETGLANQLLKEISDFLG
jgi:hypothetical protein